MANITKDDVVRIAELAHISLSDDEITKLKSELSNILEFVEQINALDTQGVRPTAQATSLEHVTREDKEVDYFVDASQLVKLADDNMDNQVKVPSVK